MKKKFAIITVALQCAGNTSVAESVRLNNSVTRSISSMLQQEATSFQSALIVSLM